MDDVVEVLEREQLALERLLFRLHHARGVLAADDERFLALAADELESAAHTVRELEAARATVVARTSDATLRGLAEHAPEPYAALLQEHHVALGRLTGEIGVMLESTQRLASHRLAELHGEGDLFPRPSPSRPNADDLDRALVAAGYESMLNASASLGLPALATFLA